MGWCYVQPDDYQVKAHTVVVMIMILIFIISNQNVYSRVNIQSDPEAKLTLYMDT